MARWLISHTLEGDLSLVHERVQAGVTVQFECGRGETAEGAVVAWVRANCNPWDTVVMPDGTELPAAPAVKA